MNLRCHVILTESSLKNLFDFHPKLFQFVATAAISLMSTLQDMVMEVVQNQYIEY